MCKVGLCTHPYVHIPHKSKYIIRIPPQQRKKNISTKADAVHFNFYTHILSYFRMYNFLGDRSSNSKRKTLQNVAMYFLKYFLLSSNPFPYNFFHYCHHYQLSPSLSLSNGTTAWGGPRPPSRVSSILPRLGWLLSNSCTLALQHHPSHHLPSAT
jgi:hypothetical protein